MQLTKQLRSCLHSRAEYLMEVKPVALDHHQLPLFTQMCKVNILMIGLGRVQCSLLYSAGNIQEKHGVH